MALDQLKAFLKRMQGDEALKQQVLAAATADDVIQHTRSRLFELSADERSSIESGVARRAYRLSAC